MRRIAIITSETPNSLYAGSMQLLRVFRGYPADKLVVVGPTPPAGARLLDCDYKTLRFPIMRWRNTRFHRHAMSLVLLSRLFRRTPAQIKQALGAFRPDAVFTVMDNFSHYFTAYEYAKAANVPLITMTMDEPDSFEQILPVFRSIQKAKIAAVYRYTERNLCVSRQMSAHISAAYSCAAETFYFGPPEGVTPRPATESARLRHGKRVVLGFAGSLSYGYGEALRSICSILEGSHFSVRIYSRDRPSWTSSSMEYAGCIPSEQLWPKFKEECDASLLVYNFRYHESRLYRTHFPTKLSEYAWLGMPMVMVGPEYATGIIWGAEHPKAAMVYTTDDYSGLVQFLEEFGCSSGRRCAMAEAAAAAALSEFEPESIRQSFARALQGKGA